MKTRHDIVVYRHVRLDANEVFYVGIGVPKRPGRKCDRSNWWKKIVNKTDYRIDILFDDMTWNQACEKEIELIKLYGRRDLGLGTLVNMTDGGDGTLGFKFTAASKAKMSISQKARNQAGTIRPPFSAQWKTNMKVSQQNRSPETLERMSLAQMGRIKSEETIRKTSESNKKPILQLDLDGNLIREWDSAISAQHEGFNASGISLCVKGVQTTHKNYKWTYD